jgi:hypothetical protein
MPRLYVGILAAMEILLATLSVKSNRIELSRHGSEKC